MPLAILVTAFFAVLPPALRLVVRGEAARARLGARLASAWGWSLCTLLGVKREVRGRIPRHDGAYVVASNHLSYLDIVVLGSIYPSLFVAKREIAGWPLFGWVAREAGTLFVDREQARDVVRAGKEIQERLALGVPITLFPEGKATDGASILPFLPSLLEPAAQAGVPCFAASLHYETPGTPEPVSSTVCWYDGRSFPHHFLGIARLPRIVAHVRFAEAPVVSPDRKELARSLWESATRTFEPVR